MAFKVALKISATSWAWWWMPGIPGTREAAAGRSQFWGQPMWLSEISSKNLKGTGYVISIFWVQSPELSKKGGKVINLKVYKTSFL